MNNEDAYFEEMCRNDQELSVARKQIRRGQEKYAQALLENEVMKKALHEYRYRVIGKKTKECDTCLLLFNKDYSSEELYDVQRDVSECFNPKFNPIVKLVEEYYPQDTVGFSDAIYTVSVTVDLPAEN